MIYEKQTSMEFDFLKESYLKNKENKAQNKVTKGYIPIQSKSVNNFSLLKNGIIEDSSEFLNDHQWNKILTSADRKNQFKKHLKTIKNQIVKRGTTSET